MKRILLISIILFTAVIVESAPPTRTYTYTSGETISSTEVTANEDNLYNYLQGGVDTIKDGIVVNADVNSAANIQASKINLTAVTQNIVNTGTLSNTGNVTVTGELDATTIKQGGYELIPQGMIMMWSGTIANIPDGWELCDGSCSVTCPDLRSKMIAGAAAGVDPGAVSGTGYVGAHTHSTPAHQHTLKTNGDAPGRNFLETQNGTIAQTTDYVVSSGAGTSGSTGTASFYALAFIIKN